MRVQRNYKQSVCQWHNLASDSFVWSRNTLTDEKRLRTHPDATALARQLRRPLTPMEARLWAQLRDRRCGGFKMRRQVPLGRYIADFYCAEARIIVEIDGDSHSGSVERDQSRDQWLAESGYRRVRVTNSDVRHHLEGVLVLIEQSCREGAQGAH